MIEFTDILHNTPFSLLEDSSPSSLLPAPLAPLLCSHEYSQPLAWVCQHGNVIACALGTSQQCCGSEGDVQLVLASARDFMPPLLESFPYNSSEFRGNKSFVLLYFPAPDAKCLKGLQLH